MRNLILAASLVALAAPIAPLLAEPTALAFKDQGRGPPPWAPAHGRRAKERAWYADDHYRDGRDYRDRRISRSDAIYRGRDGRYYCRRDDGTTGLIIGGAVGALIGRELDRGESRTVGTILGAGAGALLGREIDRGSLRCD